MFDKEALDDEEAVGSAIESNSNGIVRETVAATRNSIGYVSIGYVSSAIKPLSYDGVVATNDSARDGSYELSRYLSMITHGEANEAALEYIDYLLSEDFQLGVVAQEYIPVIAIEDE
jgi:phosphate transport system substrate-binding protein